MMRRLRDTMNVTDKRARLQVEGWWIAEVDMSLTTVETEVGIVTIYLRSRSTGGSPPARG
jgi:hypothetical protein